MEDEHGPAGDRRYQHIPTYVLRGLTELHLGVRPAMKVFVDEDRCAGHGMCLTLCPEVFDMSDDGWAVADPGDVSVELEPAAREAIANCPERAIRESVDVKGETVA